jgi:hypothetical protein
VLAEAGGNRAQLSDPAVVGVTGPRAKQRRTRLGESRRPVRPHVYLRVVREVDADGVEFGAHPTYVSVLFAVVAVQHRRVQAGQ